MRGFPCAKLVVDLAPTGHNRSGIGHRACLSGRFDDRQFIAQSHQRVEIIGRVGVGIGLDGVGMKFGQ